MGFKKINGIPHLETDGFGYSEWEYDLMDQPATATQLILVGRVHLEDLPLGGELDEAGLLSTMHGAHWGLTFDGNFVKTTERHDHASYPAANFFGTRMERADSFAPLGWCGLSSQDSDLAKRDYALLVTDQKYQTFDQGNAYYHTSMRSTFLAGKGGTDNFALESFYDPSPSKEKSNADMLMALPRNAAVGAAFAFVWRFTLEGTGEGIRFEGWINTDSLDLDNYNINTQMDPQNPKASIPVSNGWGTTGVKYVNDWDETGTNWMPTTRAPKFPTKFRALWPYATVGHDLVITNLLYRYDETYI